MRRMRLDPVYCPLQPCVAPVIWPSAEARPRPSQFTALLLLSHSTRTTPADALANPLSTSRHAAKVMICMWVCQRLQVYGCKVNAVYHVIGQEVLPCLIGPAKGHRIYPACMHAQHSIFSKF